MLCALGLEDKLIGVDAYSDYPESVKDLTIVGDYVAPDIEKIISLQPDIVFASNTLQAELIDQLKNAGITVAASEPTSYAQLIESIQLIGALGGAEQAKIEELSCKNKPNWRVKLKLRPREKRAHIIYSHTANTAIGPAGPGSFIYDVLSMAGLKFITQGMVIPSLCSP